MTVAGVVNPDVDRATLVAALEAQGVRNILVHDRGVPLTPGPRADAQGPGVNGPLPSSRSTCR